MGRLIPLTGGVSKTYVDAGDAATLAAAEAYADSLVGSATTYLCDAAIAVGDVVYLSGSDTVAKANATNLTKMPAVGIVKTKPTAVTCTVQDDGEFTTAGGLTVAVNYFVSATVDGGYTTVVPAAAGNVLQILGFARNATSLQLQVSRNIVIM